MADPAMFSPVNLSLSTVDATLHSLMSNLAGITSDFLILV